MVVPGSYTVSLVSDGKVLDSKPLRLVMDPAVQLAEGARGRYNAVLMDLHEAQRRGTEAAHTPRIRRWAARLAAGDRDLQDDLEQEGLVALWTLDPLRLKHAMHPQRFAATTALRAQWEYLRGHLRYARRMVSLDAASDPRDAALRQRSGRSTDGCR